MITITTDQSVLTITDGNDTWTVQRDDISIRRWMNKLLISDGVSHKMLTMPVSFNGTALIWMSDLETLLTAFINSTTVIALLGITDDTEFDIPAGYMLDFILFQNSEANDAILDLGLTGGGGEVATPINVNKSTTNNGLTVVSIRQMFDANLPTTLFLTDDGVGCAWNTVSVNIYIHLKKTI